MKSRSRSFGFLATTILSILSITLSIAQTIDDSTRFHVEAALVRMDVQVEEGGQLVSNLDRDDFVVYDEDQLQPILHFSSISAPVDLIFLLDVSSSMDELVSLLARTALEALTVLRPDDRVALLSFTTKSKVLVPFTTEHAKVVAPIRKIASNRLWGNTDLYRALSDSCRYIQLSGKTTGVPPENEHRRVILMMSDGIAGLATRENKTLQDLWEADATVDVMIVGPSERELVRVQRATALGLKLQDLRRIADQTGGTLLQNAKVETDLPQMLERSRTRYSLFYRRPESGGRGFRRVRVNLTAEARGKHPTARLRTRTGYFYEQVVP